MIYIYIIDKLILKENEMIKTYNQAIRDARRITIQPTESSIGLIHVSKAQLTKLVKEMIKLTEVVSGRDVRVGVSKHYPDEYWLQVFDHDLWLDIGDYAVFLTDDYNNITIA